MGLRPPGYWIAVTFVEEVNTIGDASPPNTRKYYDMHGQGLDRQSQFQNRAVHYLGCCSPLEHIVIGAYAACHHQAQA